MTAVDEAKTSLERVQQIDPKSVVRRDELGNALSFEPAEAPIRTTILLFMQIPTDQLDGLSQNFLQTIKSNADAFQGLVNDIMAFEATRPDAASSRQSFINTARSNYEVFFAALHPIISYIGSRQKDFASLERDARAKIQQVVDRADEASKILSEQKEDAARILEEVKNVAAEHGVSQQAHYFKTESENHATLAETWKKNIQTLAITAVVYLVASVFVTKIPFLAPTNSYETIQLGLSKTLIFAVIVYLLVLSARNFLSHQHNAVVNKHRQNALLTYRALAEAAGSQEKRDIVIAHAAACIFSPQETGYTKGSPQTNVTGLVESISKIVPQSSH